MRPRVWMPRDPEMVCIHAPINDPNEYYESNLTPDEAETLAWELWTDARRARYLRLVNARVKGSPPVDRPLRVEPAVDKRAQLQDGTEGFGDGVRDPYDYGIDKDKQQGQ